MAYEKTFSWRLPPHDLPRAWRRADPRSAVLAELRLRVRPEAARTARRWVAQVATEWDALGVVEDLELCTSELVTNVVRHVPTRSGAAMRLLAVRDGHRLRVEVYDAGRTLPRTRRAAPTDVGGRGLPLVARVADDHGSHRTSDGKVSWFAINAWPGR